MSYLFYRGHGHPPAEAVQHAVIATIRQAVSEVGLPDPDGRPADPPGVS
jgi:hypothetical protein